MLHRLVGFNRRSHRREGGQQEGAPEGVFLERADREDVQDVGGMVGRGFDRSI
jgi:hypothetical protein